MVSPSICRACLRSSRREIRRATPKSLGSVSTRYRPINGHVAFPSGSGGLRKYATATVATSIADARQDVASETESTEQDELFEYFNPKSSTETLFKECASQADYIVPQAFERKGKIPKTEAGEHVGEGSGWWFESLHLMPTFNTWAQVTFLHLYLIHARFRYFSDDNRHEWQQQLVNHFFWEAEHRMYIYHGLKHRSLRNKHLKELFERWRGSIMAYDEGLIKGDAVLGTAIWRNIFKADENVDWRDVALLVSFMRRGLKALDGAKDKVLLSASLKFGSPVTDIPIILKPSSGISKDFTKEDHGYLLDLLDPKEE